MHSNDTRHEPSLVQNGFFTQGLSHWFGSFLRHKRTNAVSGGGTVPSYHAEVYSDILSAYPEGIRPGINQFLDLPELYTYPARRVAGLLTLRGLGGGRFLLTALEGASTLNGRPVVAGDATATGKAFYFQHPFLYRDAGNSVAIESGESLQVVQTPSPVSLTVPTGFRAGPLIKKSTNNDQAFADHTLTASADSDFEVQVSRERDVPGVVARLGDPGSFAQGNLTFSGSGIEQLKDVARTDGPGRTGIKTGDTITFDNGVTVLAISDGLQVDDAGTPIYQLQYRNLTGASGVRQGQPFVSTNWTVYAPLSVDVTFGMPLYQYDFTLAYSYWGGTTTTANPGPSRIEFLGLGNGTISSVGTVVESIVANTAERLDYVEPNGAGSGWVRRFERIIDEFVEPVAGRPALNIPPSAPAVGSLDQGVVVTDVARTGDGSEPNKIRFTTNVYPSGETGSPNTTTAFGLTRIEAVTDDGIPLAGQYKIHTNTGDIGTDLGGNPSEIYLTGYLADAPAGNPDPAPWVRQLLDLRGPLTVLQYGNGSGGAFNTVTIQLDAGQQTYVEYNGIDLSVSAGDTILRVVADVALEPARMRADELVLFEATAVGSALYEPLLETQGLKILSIEVSDPNTSSPDFAKVYVTTEAPLEMLDLPTSTPPTNVTDGTLSQLVSSSEMVQIGNVSLWRGYQYQQLPNGDLSDVLGAELSLDPLNRTALAEDDVMPKGTIVLYAGGGACPVGFTPLRGEVESNTLGLANVQSLPLPLSGNIAYDAASDTTTLSYPGQSFDQLDDQGESISIPNTAAIFTVPLFGITNPDGSPIYRQVRVQRHRQLVEPGMTLRVPTKTYEVGTSPLVFDEQNDITGVDVVGPTAAADRGHLVIDVQPILRNDGQSSSGSAKAIRFNRLPAPKSNRYISGPDTAENIYADGYGGVNYPGLNPAAAERTAGSGANQYLVDKNANLYGGLFPQGPAADEQNISFAQVFPDDNVSPCAIFWGYRIKTDRHRLVVGTVQNGDSGAGNSVTIPELSEDPIVLNEANDAHSQIANIVVDGSPQYMRGRDVMYARWIRPTGGGEHEVLDNFVAIVQPNGSGGDLGLRQWNIYRYDRRVFHLPNDTNTEGTFLLVHPVKLYGAPGVKQVLGNAPDPPGGVQQPLGVAEGLTQARLTLTEEEFGTFWVTENPQSGTTVTVAGQLSVPTGLESLFVEPAGYLRYGDEDTLIDYGASGHTHRIQPNTELSLNNPIPRLHRNYQGEYSPVRLPVEHGHGSFTTLRYPLPAAELFGLCIKL